MDKHNIGLVTQYDFKCAVEKLLGYQIPDRQWEDWKGTMRLDKDGLVSYPELLQMFNFVLVTSSPKVDILLTSVITV